MEIHVSHSGIAAEPLASGFSVFHTLNKSPVPARSHRRKLKSFTPGIHPAHLAVLKIFSCRRDWGLPGVHFKAPLECRFCEILN